MIGVVIACHGSLALGFKSAAEMILGKTDNLETVSVDVKQDPQTIKGVIQTAIKSVDKGKGVFILTDLFGGTPSNVSLSFLDPGHIEIITGINLPLILKLLKDRKKSSFEQLKDILISKATKSILNPSDMLNLGNSN
jgi:PTS system mannose-specific IIA component